MNDLLPYKVGRRAARALKKIRKTDRVLYHKMTDAIQTVRGDPFVDDAKKGDLKGYFCIDINHVGTNYELCYALEEDSTVVLIVLIGTRENFYAQLKRYLDI